MPLNFRPKLDKIVELLLYLAIKRPDADKYQAVKFFYLADREHLNRYGRPITFETYYALEYGPVASNALNFLEGNKWVLAKLGIQALPFRTEVGKLKSGKETTYIREPLRVVDFTLFSKSDIKVFDEIIKEYGDKTFDELYNITHDHIAYKNAWQIRKPAWAHRAEMFYEEMIDDESRRATLLEDISSVAAHM